MDQNKRAKKEEEENLIVFEEAQLPVTISDLRKPTNEFITKLIEIFCNTFQIDGNTIKQPTLEQYEIILSDNPELYDDFIKSINTFAAISGISEKLFFKDLQFSDIENPTPKRTLKLTTFLANFIIYFRNKVPELKERINKLEEKRNDILEIKRKTQELQEKIDGNRKYNEWRAIENEKLKIEIEEMRQKAKMKKNEMDKKQVIISRLEKKLTKNKEKYNEKKSKANEINATTNKLKAQIVESPEKLYAEIEKFEKEREQKIHQTKMFYESLEKKSELLEKKEQTMSLVTEESDKLAQAIDIITNLKECLSKLETIRKEMKNKNANILKLEKKEKQMEQKHCHSTSNLNDLKGEIKGRILIHHRKYNELLENSKALEIEVEKEQEEYCDASKKKDAICKEILTLEEDNERFLNECNELYRKEISSEIDFANKVMEFKNMDEEK